MKEKLEVIREALGLTKALFEDISTNTQKYSGGNSTRTIRFADIAKADIDTNKALALLDSLIAELDSAELVDKVATALVSVYYNPDSPAFDACIKEVRKEAKAAINAIKGI